MKLLVVLSSLIALCAGTAIPLVPGDNSHYVEGESRYIWMPDGNGVPVLVDLQEPVNYAFLNSRSGAENEYWLYTRSNPSTAQIIVHGDTGTIASSNYAFNKPLKVIVHGWTSSGNSERINSIKDAYLETSDVNVIILDWNRVAGNINYVTAVNGVPSVGEFAGNFLTWLIDVTGSSWLNVHLIGYSLGAHVVGVAGRTAGSRAARITGLDPAGPLWRRNANALNATDAVYVEGIHTDGGILGIFNDICQTNFYPNGGTSLQPGCLTSSCSHGRAPEFFASSLYTDHFVGRRCADLQEARRNKCTGDSMNMGNSDLNKQGSGIFGLTTERSWPY